MLTEAMATSIVTAVTSNVTLLVPVGITILGLMVGVSLIPKIVYKFL